MKKTTHFKIYELVCPDVYKRDGEKAFRYFRPVLLDFLDWIREELGQPVYINDWYWGGDNSQRGLRCNLCSLVKNAKVLYLTAHVNGTGVDFNVQDITPDDVREWISSNISRFFDKNPQYKRKCRLESKAYAPTWVHIDFYDHDAPGIIKYVQPIR